MSRRLSRNRKSRKSPSSTQDPTIGNQRASSRCLRNSLGSSVCKSNTKQRDATHGQPFRRLFLLLLLIAVLRICGRGAFSFGLAKLFAVCSRHLRGFDRSVCRLAAAFVVRRLTTSEACDPVQMGTRAPTSRAAYDRYNPTLIARGFHPFYASGEVKKRETTCVRDAKSAASRVGGQQDQEAGTRRAAIAMNELIGAHCAQYRPETGAMLSIWSDPNCQDVRAQISGSSEGVASYRQRTGTARRDRTGAKVARLCGGASAHALRRTLHNASREEAVLCCRPSTGHSRRHTLYDVRPQTRRRPGSASPTVAIRSRKLSQPRVGPCLYVSERASPCEMVSEVTRGFMALHRSARPGRHRRLASLVPSAPQTVSGRPYPFPRLPDAPD